MTTYLLPWDKATFCDFSDAKAKYLAMILASQHNMVVYKKISACVCLFLDSDDRSKVIGKMIFEDQNFLYEVYVYEYESSFCREDDDTHQDHSCAFISF